MDECWTFSQRNLNIFYFQNIFLKRFAPHRSFFLTGQKEKIPKGLPGRNPLAKLNPAIDFFVLHLLSAARKEIPPFLALPKPGSSETAEAKNHFSRRLRIKLKENLSCFQVPAPITEGGEKSCTWMRNYKAGRMPYVPAFVCCKTAGKRIWYTDYSGADGTFECWNNDDLYSCYQQGRTRG